MTTAHKIKVPTLIKDPKTGKTHQEILPLDEFLDRLSRQVHDIDERVKELEGK